MQQMICVLLIIFSSMALQAQVVLEDVKTKKNNDGFIIELSFNKAIDKNNVNVELINQTVQVNIKNGLFKKGKDLLPVEDDRVKSVFTYQPEKNLLRTRIIHHKPIDATELEGFIDIKALGKSLIISVMDPTTTLPVKVDESSISFAKPPQVLEQPEKEVEAVEESKSLTTFNEKKEKTQEQEVPESQIPVFAKKESVQETNMSQSYYRMLASIFIVILVGIASVVFTKWWSKKTKKTVEATKIQMTTQFHLGNKKSLAIVQVAGEYILIGVTDHNISMIKTLSLLDEDFSDEMPKHFATELDKSFEFDREEPETNAIAKANKQSVVDKTHEELDVHNIKDVIANKLKNMRSI
ncbi:MAG: flagellar biosynthetic protein FliO [Bdellovibrionales bacterium]|nr:flagellar biosynthetic protein FliO [Bdellovibrionales bacterium]